MRGLKRPGLRIEIQPSEGEELAGAISRQSICHEDQSEDWLDVSQDLPRIAGRERGFLSSVCNRPMDLRPGRRLVDQIAFWSNLEEDMKKLVEVHYILRRLALRCGRLEYSSYISRRDSMKPLVTFGRQHDA